jgi:hypothetical protein
MAEKELVEGLAKVAVTEEVDENKQDAFPPLRPIAPELSFRPSRFQTPKTEWDLRDASDRSHLFKLTPLIQNRDFELAVMISDPDAAISTRLDTTHIDVGRPPRDVFGVSVKKGTEIGFALSQTTRARLRIQVTWIGPTRGTTVANVFEHNANGPVITQADLPLIRVPVPLEPAPDSVNIGNSDTLYSAIVSVTSDVPRLDCPLNYFSSSPYHVDTQGCPDPSLFIKPAAPRSSPVRRWIESADQAGCAFRRWETEIRFDSK